MTDVPRCRFPSLRLYRAVDSAPFHLVDGEHSFVAYFPVVDGRNDIAALAVVDDVEVQNQCSVVAVCYLRVLSRRKFASRVLDRHPVGFRQGGGGECQQHQHRYAR
ncbi:hypothetical protein SDC9_114503 [bioreactor metagenome]|uniref:Uncharacterized protein n=1 Tax=bioreactor metagenome TaxID=1076179 RepID=A0A645BQ64_9ZZZZ